MAFAPAVELNSFVQDINRERDFFKLGVSSGNKTKLVFARSVIVALGAGIFQPVKLTLPNLENYEGKHIFYSVDNLANVSR